MSMPEMESIAIFFLTAAGVLLIAPVAIMVVGIIVATIKLAIRRAAQSACLLVRSWRNS